MTDTLADLNRFVDKIQQLERLERHHLLTLAAVGATDESIAEAAIVMTLARFPPSPPGAVGWGATPVDLAVSAVEALRLCGRLPKTNTEGDPMSVRDEGATHYFGDDCPGGHRAANVAGVDWDDQETADEANARDAVEQEFADLALAARDKHVFVNVTTCACGFQPPMSRDWERHRMEVALAAVVPLLRAQLEADVLREAAEAYAAHWRSAAGVGRAVNLPSTHGFVAWLENRAAENERATALEQAQPLPVAAISEAGSLEAGTPVIDMGWLSLPAEIQAEGERAASQGQERSEEKKHG